MWLLTGKQQDAMAIFRFGVLEATPFFWVDSKWAWVAIKPPGIGPQVLVHGSTWPEFHLGYPFF